MMTIIMTISKAVLSKGIVWKDSRQRSRIVLLEEITDHFDQRLPDEVGMQLTLMMNYSRPNHQ